jgi:hypothetical protein
MIRLDLEDNRSRWLDRSRSELLRFLAQRGSQAGTAATICEPGSGWSTFAMVGVWYDAGTMKRTMAVANLLGLILGVAGGVLLTLSLSLKTSHYRFVETERTGKPEVVICHDNKEVVAGYGGGLVTNDACPKSIGPSEAPVIETNDENRAVWGLRLVIIGFVLQLPAAIVEAFRSRRV